DVFAGKKSAQIREILISESAWEEMTCLFAPSLSQIEPEKTESPFASLSERELQIMLMITKGQKVNEISEQLNLSPKTVNSYRYRMFSKLNIHGDVELTHLAIRHGLCNAESLASQ
ncbi:LuxR C-terminal-related transcriptional regulator, partial [Klebsiella pneumoniae]|uniref:LuxR C-terminal-related transcriptional regulator n=1 Tax=Klebsiella pneumoniae TaxID=573 RepID=UPI00216624E1